MEEENRRRYYCPADETNDIRTVKLAAWAASTQDPRAATAIASSLENVVSLGSTIIAAMNAALTAPEWARAIVDESKREEADFIATSPELCGDGDTLDEGARKLIANFPMAMPHSVAVE